MPNGDTVHTVRGADSVFVHTIKSDSDGNVIFHRLEKPAQLASARGPTSGTSSKLLGGAHRNPYKSVYAALGLKNTPNKEP